MGPLSKLSANTSPVIFSEIILAGQSSNVLNFLPYCNVYIFIHNFPKKLNF